MRFFIVSIIGIVLSGLAFGWLIVNHPYIAECLMISFVMILVFTLLVALICDAIRKK